MDDDGENKVNHTLFWCDCVSVPVVQHPHEPLLPITIRNVKGSYVAPVVNYSMGVIHHFSIGKITNANLMDFYSSASVVLLCSKKSKDKEQQYE